MKFENIKVNDTVLVPHTVTYGWRNNKLFYIAEKVIRVTKTQFVTESNQRFKKSGISIGVDSFYNAQKIGDTIWEGDDRTFYDQTEEMNAFKEKLKFIQEIKRNVNVIEKLTESMVNNELLDVKMASYALKGIIGVIQEDKEL